MDNSKAIIKGLIAMRCMSSQALADGLGITVPAVRNKLSRNSWAINDLVKLAQACASLTKSLIAQLLRLNLFRTAGTVIPRPSANACELMQRIAISPLIIALLLSMVYTSIICCLHYTA